MYKVTITFEIIEPLNNLEIEDIKQGIVEDYNTDAIVSQLKIDEDKS